MRTRKLMARYLQPFSFVLLISFLLPVKADPQLDEVRRIADSGAVQLALKLFEEQAPDIADEPQQWATWERARLAFYARHHQWQDLINHIDVLPPGVPDDIFYEAETWRATALLALDRTQDARAVLRRLLWQEARTVEQVNSWRSLVIRSYLRDKMAVPANTAMLRYQQDYGDNDKNDALLRARVLLQSGKDKAAVDLLEKHDSPVLKATWLLASLRSATIPVSNVIKIATKSLASKKLSNEDRFRFYAVIGEAAGVEKDTGEKIDAIEEMFSLRRDLELDDGLFSYKTDDLWNAYLEHAQSIANKKQLLVGDDAAWVKLAKSYKKNALRQRAMYAWLAKNAADEKLRTQSHEDLVRSLQKRKNGVEILRHLYAGLIKSNPSSIPATAAYILIDQALTESDITLASGLLGDLLTPPAGIDPLLWHLRRARVFVLAGQHEKGVAVLNRIISSQQQLDKQQVDRFMQVLFDLQTVKRHDESYKVFARLYQHSNDLQLRREILYWMADSKKAVNDYEKASKLYLQSAINPLDAAVIDLWGQSAYYQAADALAKAGYISDARNVYTRLLSITEDAGRRAVLNRQLQQLLLEQQVVKQTAE